MAYQRGYWGNIWNMVGRLAALGGVIVCVAVRADTPYLAAVYMGLPYVVMLLGGVGLFVKEPFLRPSPSAVRWSAFRSIMSIAWLALLAHIGGIVLQVGLPLVLANRLTTEAVTPFAVTRAPLTMGLMLIVAMVFSLWPAYGEAAARGDVAWVRRTFRRSVWAALSIQVPIFVIMASFGPLLVRLLSRNEVEPDWMLVLAMDVWFLCLAVDRCITVALNGLNHMMGRATFGLVFRLLGLLVAFLCAPHYSLATVVWSVVGVSEVPRLVGLSLELWWVLRRLGREAGSGRP
jgi:O-antigen/teichoic acid export membrane protein